MAHDDEKTVSARGGGALVCGISGRDTSQTRAGVGGGTYIPPFVDRRPPDIYTHTLSSEAYGRRVFLFCSKSRPSADGCDVDSSGLSSVFTQIRLLASGFVYK